MDDLPRSNRPTPRTAASMEAELRRRVRTSLTQARAEADGELTDAALAGVIAQAIAAALGWHLESPEHARNATFSSRTWRPAGGPRGGGQRDFEPRAGGQRDFEPRGGGQRDFEPRGRGQRDFEPRERQPRPPYPPRGPREFDAPFDERPRPSGPSGPSRPRGGGPYGARRPPPPKRSSGGGFGPRKPRRPN